MGISQLSIFDLENEINQMREYKKNEKALLKAEKTYKIQSRHNATIDKMLLKAKNSDKIKEIKSKKFDLSVAETDIKLAKGEDYEVSISDNIKNYKISIEELLSKENPALFLLNEFENNVLEEIKRMNSLDYLNYSGKQKAGFAGSNLGLHKLLTKIRSNKETLETGQDKISDEKRVDDVEIRRDTEEELDVFIERWKKKGATLVDKYFSQIDDMWVAEMQVTSSPIPIYVEIIGTQIILNL